MPTSDSSWSASLRVIGELERGDHSYLSSDDTCAFFGEYTARAGYTHSATNSIITNIKKKLAVKGTPQWRYKGWDIQKVARAIADNIDPAQLSKTTFVPIPPSKPPSHPDYDDRVAQIARAIAPDVDVREILYTVVEREPAHISSLSRDPSALRQGIGIREVLRTPAAQQVVLLDDVLTTGCSFKVCKGLLHDIWPGAPVYGLFVARRVIEHPPPIWSVDEGE